MKSNEIAANDWVIREECPTCGSKESTELLTIKYGDPFLKEFLNAHYRNFDSTWLEGFDYQLIQCKNCNLVYQKGIPSETRLSELYNALESGSIETDSLPFSLKTARNLVSEIDFLVGYSKINPSELKVLDFGFGDASWCKMAKAYGLEVYGIEISTSAQVHARQLDINVIELEDLTEEIFDYINCDQVFEHLSEPGKILERLVVGLKRSGLLIISVPNTNRMKSRIRKMHNRKISKSDIMPLSPLEHVNTFTHESLVSFAINHNLELVKPNLVQLYNAQTGWFSLKQFLFNFLRPLYRHYVPKTTYLYLRKSNNPSAISQA